MLTRASEGTRSALVTHFMELAEEMIVMAITIETDAEAH
jgi:hypothetical protein